MKTNLQLASKKGTLCVVLFVLFFLFSFSIRAQMPAIENLTPPHKPLILPIKNALPNRASRTEANTVESKTVNVTAGSLYSAFTSDERATVTDLTVTGTIDARDFATMRDSMPELAVLNISGATITAYSGTSGTAGNTSLDYPANTIPDYAFVLFNSSSDYYAKTTLISVQLPLTATAVGRLAFLFCYNLNSITIPNSVTHIGQGSFEYCYGINAVSIPASVANIDASAFFGCNGYVTVDLNNPNFSSLNGSLFNKNQTTLIHVPYYTAGSYTIPSTVTSIIKGAFGVCEFLTSVTIPSSVTFIDNNAFRYCYNLTSLSIPASVTVIGDYAFGNCSNLASFNVYSATPVNLSASINAFYGVNTDTCLLRVPAGAENAYKSATLWENFVYLSSITSKSVNVTAGGLYSALTELERDSLTDLTVAGAIDARDFVTMRDYLPKLVVLDLESATIAEYIGTQGTDDSINIDYPANTIPDEAFNSNYNRTTYQGMTTLSTVRLPLTATSIGRFAFLACYNLNSIALPSSLTTIGHGSFEYCRGLKAISIPASVSTIDDYAFWGASGTILVDFNSPAFLANGGILYDAAQTTLIHAPINLTDTCTIPFTVTSIYIGAFGYCSEIPYIMIPGSVTNIGINAMAYCSGLNAISIPSSVTSIGDHAFSASTGAITVEPGNPNYASNNGILYDKGQTRLIQATLSQEGICAIPTTVSTIAIQAFERCGNLTSVTIPTSVTVIEPQAFMGSSGLFYVDENNPNYSSLDGVLFNKAQTCLIQAPTALTDQYIIPSQVDTIGADAFGYCSNLTSVTIPSSVTSIGNYAFEVCWNIYSIYSYPLVPVDLNSTPYVFDNIDLDSCILYVPSASISAYQSATLWKDFKHIVGIATSVDTHKATTISLYPNPAIDGFYIKGLTETSLLTILDSSGKVVLSRKVTGADKILVDMLPEGNYFVLLKSGKNVILEKLIKE